MLDQEDAARDVVVLGDRVDVIVVGGGAAGLSAALTLARARRQVTVIDSGQPRNAPADGVHGLLGLEGITPDELLARGRDEVARYGGQHVRGEVVDVGCASYGFVVTLRSGAALHGRRLLIATGLVDELPDVPGLRERWGREVVHCPYCHGWEVRDKRIGVLASGPMSVHQAILFKQWSQDVQYFERDIELSGEDRTKLRARGVQIITGPVSHLQVVDDRLAGVQMNDGQLVDVEVVAVASRMVARADAFKGIGITPTIHPVGSFIEVDPTGRTAVPGAWAAGNSSDLSAQVSAAAADGARAAQHVNADLVTEDTNRAIAAMAEEKALR